MRKHNRDGEPLYRIEFEIVVEAAQLAVDKAVLSNVRVIRDYLHTRKVGRVESWRGNPIEQPLSVSGVAPFVPGWGGS